MIENNTQPLSTYTKAPPAGGAVPSGMATPPASPSAPNIPGQDNSQKKSNVKFKTAMAILGLILFLAIASVGVFISQRQQQVSGPVAPTAPTSRPSADTFTSDSCSIDFTVPAPNGVARCDAKEAFVVNENGQEVEFDNRILAVRGAEFYYRIRISAETLTAGGVTFRDVLHPDLEFVEDSRNTVDSSNVSTENSQVIITDTFQQMQPGDSEEIVFKVRVRENADIGAINNVAEIITQGASDGTSRCGIMAHIEPTGVAQCISKKAYRLTADNSLGEQLSANDDVSRGEEFVYEINVATTEYTHGEVEIIDQLPDSVTYLRSNAADVSVTDSGQVTIQLGDMVDNASTSALIYAQVNDDADAGEVENTAMVVTGTEDEDPSLCAVAFNVPATACNSECTTDAQCPSTLSCIENRCRLESNPTDTQCQAAEEEPLVCNNICDPNGANECPSNLECLAVGSEYRCRLESNVSSASCTAASEPQCNDSCDSNSDCPATFVCHQDGDDSYCRLPSNLGDTQCRPPEGSKPTPTPTPKPTPTPTPAPGCNETCATNADCSNTDHICYTTADGSNKCRLAENVESNTCTMPSTQPELPPELPKTGPEEWTTWLKTGLVTLGLGAILLLLL